MLNAANFGSGPPLNYRAVTLPKYESARLGGCKLNSVAGKFRNGARTLENVCSVPVQETAKNRAKFGWLPLSDVAAVTLPRRLTY